MLSAGSTAVAPKPGATGVLARQRRRAHVCGANYRWSADSGAGGRKCESLYGFGDDSSEVRGAGSAGVSASAASGGAPGDTWGSWQQGQEASTTGAGSQQAEWDAAADFEAFAAERAERRRSRRSGGGSGRLGQRRQQADRQQQQQVQAVDAEVVMDAPGQVAGDVAAAADLAADDPWVEADLRQLRRRQRAAATAAGRQRPPAASSGGTAGAGAAPAQGRGGWDAEQPAAGGSGRMPDAWAAEWGPAPPAGTAAAAAASEDLGWGAQSWAGEGNGVMGPSRRQQRPQDDEAGAGPGSAWEFAQQQRDLRRQRRRRRAGLEADADEASFAAAGSAAAAGNGRAWQQQPGQEEEGWGYVEGSFGRQQRRPGPGAGLAGEEFFDSDDAELDADVEDVEWEEAGEYSARYEPGVSAEPDIALLSPDELDRVLPIVPFSEQASFFGGSATDGVQRWGASLAMTVVLSKVAVLAATSLTWPLWWPWALAAKKNLAVRRQYRYGGLWRTQVLAISFTGRPKPFSASEPSAGGLLGGSTMRLAKVVVGDPEGAQTELVLPYDARYELIQPGEPAELVVLSSDPAFQGFKAVKDVYLPGSGLWVSEYPFADRTNFLDVSLQVERESQEPEPEPEPPYEVPYEQPPPQQQQYQQQQYQQQQQQQAYGGQDQYSGAGAYGSGAWQPDGPPPAQPPPPRY